MDLASQGVSLISAYVSVASILAVYHLFALQAWVERCAAIDEAAKTIAIETTSDDLARLRIKIRCESALRSYPWWQIIAVIGGMVAMAAIGLVVATKLKGIPLVYTGVPVIALLAIILFATVASTVQARRGLRRTIAEL